MSLNSEFTGSYIKKCTMTWRYKAPNTVKLSEIISALRTNHKPRKSKKPFLRKLQKYLWFSMQVVMNKCFFLNLEKILVQICLVVFEKTQKPHTLIPKNDVTEPKTKLL